MKKIINKSFITITLSIIFSIVWVIDEQKITMKILGFLNSYFISYILVEVFASIYKLDVNKEKMTRNINLACLLWGITFFILNTVKYGTVIKLLNILAVFVVGTSTYALAHLHRKEKKEVGCIPSKPVSQEGNGIAFLSTKIDPPNSRFLLGGYRLLMIDL